MINLFTRKLPKEISRSLYFEYQRFQQPLKRLYFENFYDLSEKQFEILEILLSMGVFYNLVLKELENAASFSSRMRKKGVGAIKIGNYLLDETESKTIWKALYHFQHLMDKFGIKETMFEFNDAKTFLNKNIEFVKEW